MNMIEHVTAQHAAFDYALLPADVQTEAKAVAQRVRERNQAAVIETGRDLLAIKDRLGHGHFGPWLQAEFGMTERTAQRYMRAATEFGDKPDIVSYLPPATVYQLAAPSTPAPIRQQIVKRLEAGERLAPAAVGEMVREAKDAARKAAAWAKLSPEEQKRQLRKEERQRSSKEQGAAEDLRERLKSYAQSEREDRAATQAAAMVANSLGPQGTKALAALLKQCKTYEFERLIMQAAGHHEPRYERFSHPIPDDVEALLQGTELDVPGYRRSLMQTLSSQQHDVVSRDLRLLGLSEEGTQKPRGVDGQIRASRPAEPVPLPGSP